MDKLMPRKPATSRRRLGRTDVVYRTAGGGTLIVTDPTGRRARLRRPRFPRS
jgi:hypothetical protein